MHSPLFAPLVALVLWSFVMCGWLYATRIPAMTKGHVVYDPNGPVEAFHAQLPASVRWKADNYNHLMEQPTLFYAVVLTLALIGASDIWTVVLAWLYVGLRVVHSLIQATVNIVLARFGVFAISTLVLLALAIRAALLVF